MSATDRGLRAVRRVREGRELDARLGLHRARSEESERRAVAARLASRLADGDRLPALVTGAELAARRAALLRLGISLTEATTVAEAAGRVADSAQAHWQVAHSRTRAIDALLERRAAARRVEQQRAEDRHLDEVAGQAWQRRRTEAAR
ncbi:MAG TPA: flagellar FliJ family protein [Nocardioides sp.]|nr:flagellar FliJ family protein [Nocardioides sp.]